MGGGSYVSQICLLSCFLGGWWEVCVQVCVRPWGSLLHGLSWQSEAQPESRPGQSAGAGRWHCSPHPLWWNCSLPAGGRGAVCGRLALPRWLQLLTRRTSRDAQHTHTRKHSQSLLMPSLKISELELPSHLEGKLGTALLHGSLSCSLEDLQKTISSQAKNEWGKNLPLHHHMKERERVIWTW